MCGPRAEEKGKNVLSHLSVLHAGSERVIDLREGLKEVLGVEIMAQGCLTHGLNPAPATLQTSPALLLLNTSGHIELVVTPNVVFPDEDSSRNGQELAWGEVDIGELGS